MSRIAIITARGGSKRIPRKNIREFCGKPILAYSIEAALGTGIFDEVMVSTDDEEIASVAESLGARVPFLRSEEASNDHAPMIDAIREVISRYAELDRSFEEFCCIYPTAPTLSPSELLSAKSLMDNGATAVIPVTDFDFPPQRAFVESSSGELSFAYPQYALARSQDLDKMVHECGRFFMARVKPYLEYGTALMPGSRAMYVSPALVQDIDTEEDWAVAELKYRMITEREG